VRLDPSDREDIMVELNHPLQDQVLVKTSFDGIFRNESHTGFAVCKDILVPAGICYNVVVERIICRHDKRH